MSVSRPPRADGRPPLVHLSGIEPSDSLIEHYAAAHAARAELLETTDPTDQYLVRLACSGFCGFRLADGWCAFFRRSGVLRRKLVLLTALLECERSTWEAIDRPYSSGLSGFTIAATLNLALDLSFALLAAPLVVTKVWPRGDVD